MKGNQRNLQDALNQPSPKNIPSTVVPYAAFSKALSKVNRFETYANLTIFRAIFGSMGEKHWIDFSQKHCGKMIAYTFSLNLGDREKLIRYLQDF